jgi:hypothetical protein
MAKTIASANRENNRNTVRRIMSVGDEHADDQILTSQKRNGGTR